MVAHVNRDRIRGGNPLAASILPRNGTIELVEEEILGWLQIPETTTIEEQPVEPPIPTAGQPNLAITASHLN